jgi:hypothetical protein
MNCEIVQRRLMSMEDPAEVPADLRAHLAACGSCRDWQGQLVQLERHIPFLVVPLTRAKTRFVKKFLGEPRKKQEAEQQTVLETAAVTMTLPSPALSRSPMAQRATRQRVLAGLAAALLLGILGWWLFRPAGSEKPDTPPMKTGNDPLLASLLHYDLQLATANTPRERIALLADVAQALHDESRSLAVETAGNQLKDLAGLYKQVVHYGITKQASAIPPAERARVFKPLIDQLEKAAQASERLARRMPPEQTRPVQDMATTAWEGRRVLATLLSGGKG